MSALSIILKQTKQNPLLQILDTAGLWPCSQIWLGIELEPKPVRQMAVFLSVRFTEILSKSSGDFQAVVGTEPYLVRDEETAWMKNKKGKDTEGRASFSEMVEMEVHRVD